MPRRLPVGLFVLLVCASNLSARAEENLLGTPTAIDPKRPGALVLHGGGRVTDDVFERFIELAGGPRARIVFVPCAGFRRGWYDSDEEMTDALAHRYSGWARLAPRGQIESFQFLFTDDPDDASTESFVEPLETATGVWFSGGDQNRLNYRFVEFPKQTHFQKALVGVMQRGGVVGGTSAGMAALPEIMTMWEERDRYGAPAYAVPAHGFGLLRLAIVEQHFDGKGGRLERFTGLLRDSARLDELAARRGVGAKLVGLAVEESTALVVRGDRLEVLGEANAHVFLKSPNGKSIAWHQLAPGDSARLARRANRAAVLDLEQTMLTE